MQICVSKKSLLSDNNMGVFFFHFFYLSVVFIFEFPTQNIILQLCTEYADTDCYIQYYFASYYCA